MSVQFAVEQRFIGLIIGKRGQGLRDIKEQSGAQINVPRETMPDSTRLIELTGDSEQISKAQQIIQELLSVDNGPSDGGKRGFETFASNYQEVPQSSDGMQKRSRVEPMTSSAAQIPMGLMGGMSGMDFNSTFGLNTLASMQSMPMGMTTAQGSMMGMMPQMGMEFPMGGMGGQMGGMGGQMQPNRGGGGVRNRSLAGGKFKCSVLLEDHVVGLVVGKGGDGLKQLKTQSGVTLDLQREHYDKYRLLTLTGDYTQQVNGVHILCQKLALWKPFDGSSISQASVKDYQPEINILLPNQSAGLLIGKGGSGLRDLKSQSQVTISLEKEELVSGSGERLLVLKGAADQINNAMGRVLEVLSVTSAQNDAPPNENA